MADPDFDRRILDLARAQANEELDRRETERATRIQSFAVAMADDEGLAELKAATTLGFADSGPRVVLAEGDSWFDYPGPDILDYLEDVFDYDVQSLAKATHRAEDMAYADGQLDDLARKLEKLLADGKAVRAILLSAGGNDLLGTEFGMLLEHVNSGLDPLNPQVVDGVINLRVRTAYLHILAKVTQTAIRTVGHPLPILIHGYAPPVPDGRGVLGGWWFLPGPWMAPGFRDKGLGDTQLERRKEILVRLIEIFHRMLRELTELPEFAHVHFVDLAPETLSTGPDYKDFWANEIHPTKKGFEIVARRFAEVLAGLPA
ncbi:MAG: hypothetical protein SF066_05455 [Thermoanaerobaculia bacterium]|nr:hypothetical protein [Thermoanaerobaculia bacterium]